MTIQNQTSSVTHNGNGLTTEWPYTFEIPDADSLRVGLFDIATNVLTPINDTDFTVTGLGTPTGGEVTYPLVGAPISAAKRLVIWREVPLTQEMDVTNQSPYYPEVLEDQLDLIVMMIQQLQGESDRAIKVTLGSNLTPDEFIEQLQQGAADAAASADQAEQWSLLAQKWAENPQDVEVVPGEYSALHWAMEAADIVATIALPAVPVALSYLRRNAGNTAYEARTPTETRADIEAMGGSTGGTDNRLLRSDGTGGATVQNSSVTVDDSGNMSGVAALTATGDAAINKVNPFLTLNKAASGQTSGLIGATNGLSRWRIDLGASNAESGSNAGSDFQIVRFNDAGSSINSALTINRATGSIFLPSGQVEFPATQNPSSGPNTLDDYEEGTWTPALSFGGSTTGITYSTQIGTYTKIGRFTAVVATMALTSKGIATGSAAVVGSPVTTTNFQPGTLPFYNGFVAGVVPSVMALATSISMYNMAAGVVLTDASFTNTSAIYFGIAMAQTA